MHRQITIYGSLLLIVGLASCAPLPEDEISRTTVDPNRFEQLPTKSSVEIYRRSDASLKPYAKILLRPLAIELRSGWQPERDASQDHDIHKARQRIASIFENEMASVLESGGRYDVVAAPAPDVLELRPQIIDLYVKAVDDEVSASDAVRTYEINDAELTFTGDLRDSMTGTVLYRFYDHRTAAIGGLVLDSVDARNEELRRLVAEWGQQLQRALDQTRAE
jgi:Protein of unknown function (DUF3313)